MAVKGYFFTLDALLAVGVLLGALILFSSFGHTQTPIVHLNYLSADLLASLDALQFSELGPTAYNIVNNATTPVNTNQSVIAVLGELWANGDMTVAEQLALFSVENQIPNKYGTGIWMDDEQIYARVEPAPASRASARKIISGLTKAKPTKGYIARATASDLTRRTTRILSFSPEGSGWKGSNDLPGQAIVDKYFTITSNQSLTNAQLAISVHLHQGNTNWTVVNINNGTCTYSRDSIASSGEGYYDIKNVTTCLNTGTNRINLDMRNINYNGHVHPGMLLRMDFSETTALPLYTVDKSERFYFDNLISVPGYGSGAAPGAWQVVPFHIPNTATNVSAYLKIAAKGVYDYTGSSTFYSWSGFRRRRDYDYILFVNQNTPFASADHPSANPTYTYGQSQLGPRLVNGTNVAVVYFNNYGDESWGNSNITIYSDPINDPNGSSFVEINYTITSELPYGTVEIAKINEAGGAEDYTKTVNFSFPQNSQMSDVYGHIAQRYSYLVKVEADDYNPPTTIVFDSPASRAVPTDVYIPTTTLSGSPTAMNFARFTDRNNNDILPNTSVEYRFYLPAFVGYGDVFPTLAQASSDAQARLEAILQDYIDAGLITVTTSNLTNVPTLWGPTIAEVRVWR